MATSDCRPAPHGVAHRRLRLRVALAVFALATLLITSCSSGNLTYREVTRDFDAIVRLDTTGNEPKLAYQREVSTASWYARAALMLPFKPFLLLLLNGVSPSKFENPSGQVRDLIVEMAPKSGRDLERCAATVQRLLPVLSVDPMALNRLSALDGLAVVADALQLDLAGGLDEGLGRLEPEPGAEQYRSAFDALAPGQRTPPGSVLPTAEAARYRSVLAALSARPLPTWIDRRLLIAALRQAWRNEPDEELRDATATALRAAVRHAVQWGVVLAVLGREPALVEVRLRALEILHRAGGPDSVPLLLALLANTQERVRAGEPVFDPDVMMQRRLIHLCGQLDRKRALQRVRLPGRESWEAIAPAAFLAQIVLEKDAFNKPTYLPAREALARCLQRPRVGLGDDLAPDAVDWVAQWYDEYQKALR